MEPALMRLAKHLAAALFALAAPIAAVGQDAPPNVHLQIDYPPDHQARELFWGLKRDGRLRASGRLPCLGLMGKTTHEVRSQEPLTDGPATLHLCLNRDDLESYIPSFGELFQQLPVEVDHESVRASAPQSGWKQRTLSDPGHLLTIHYHRFEGDYQAVGIWTWDERRDRTRQPCELFEVGRDDFGLIFQLDTANYGRPGERIGLLPRMNGDWTFKDGGDRYWSSELGREVYLVQDSDTVQKTKPDVSPKLVAATLDGRKTITLRFTHALPAIPLDQIVVRDETDTTAPVTEVAPLRPSVDGRSRSFSVKLRDDPDVTKHALRVEVRGFAPRPVQLGRILRGRRFFDPETPLGTIYTPEATTFGLFSPMAEAVDVVIAKKPTGGTRNAQFPLACNDRGVWSVTVPGDLNGRFYSYKLRGPGLDANREVTDIYATCAQGLTGRALIVDLDRTNPPGFDPSARVPLASPTDAVIYEMHVRDFTIAPNSGVEYKGKYLGLAESGTHVPRAPAIQTGLDHLVELGVTHVQLMPIQDFENAETDDDAYNWGYVTVFFNTPEGWFATTPEGDARIRELKQAVHALHSRDIGVILDVVYNHTSQKATFDLIAPGYYFRMKLDGSYWNGSGCGNEIQTDNPMVRRFIVDSLTYWVTEFGIDGFRFDLMGLMDFKTLETIRDELRRINPPILLYGEPWTGGASGLRRISDQSVIRGSGIGAFNDHFRDAIKGDRNDGAPGFIQAGDRIDGVRNGIVGAIHDWAAHPTDAITYCACHDNLTTWDKIVQSAPDAPDDVRKRMQRFAGLLVLTSQGTPFLHSGQELCRSKGGDHNSYAASDEVNRIDWSLKKTNRDVFDYYRGLIALRKAHPVFRLRTREEVERRLHWLEAVPSGRCLAYELNGEELRGESFSKTLVLLNGDTTEQTFALPPGRWLIAADADRVGTTALAEATDRVTLPPHSGMILHK